MDRSHKKNFLAPYRFIVIRPISRSTSIYTCPPNAKSDKILLAVRRNLRLKPILYESRNFASYFVDEFFGRDSLLLDVADFPSINGLFWLN